MSPADPYKTIGERLGTAGWRAGSVLSTALTKSVVLQRAGQPNREIAHNEHLVVVSQTCDVVAPKLHLEPFVEVLVVKQCTTIDPNKAKLRSTRHLSFLAKSSGPIFEAHATDRFWIPRELFDGHAPDPERSLSSNASERILEWLGLRYTRPAWPDALVRRLPKQEIERILRDIALSVAEIRVGIADRDKELPAESPYKLAVYAVMDEEIYKKDLALRRKCIKTFLEFLDLLRRCSGIEVIDGSDVIPGNEFSWQMVQMTDHWNFANLTISAADE